MHDAIWWVSTLTDLGVQPQTAGRWADAFAQIVNGDTAAIAHFLGQVLHESSMLERVEENLRYSAERLVQVWPHRFPNVEVARPYSFNAAALANKVYGGRLGNTEPGDGFKYRGRGPIQLTGKDNYRWAQEQTGVQFVDNPDLMTRPFEGLFASALWFQNNALDKIPGGVEAVTRAVNGGVNGLAEREELTARAEQRITQEA